MAETPSNAPEEQIHSLLKDSEELGRKVKETLLNVRSQRLPNLPTIKVLGPPRDYLDSLGGEKGLILDAQGYMKFWGFLEQTAGIRPNTNPMTILTEDGIFIAPMKLALFGKTIGEVVPDWRNKTEIELHQYPSFLERAMQAINEEAQKQDPTENSG